MQILILTDGGHMTSWEVVLSKSQQNTTLANTTIPNDNQFDQMIVLFSIALHASVKFLYFSLLLKDFDLTD